MWEYKLSVKDFRRMRACQASISVVSTVCIGIESLNKALNGFISSL